MFTSLAILLNCTDWAIEGWIARVQIKSTLECKVKKKGQKRHFFWYLSGQTIHLNQILCVTTHIIKKISRFCLVLGCAWFLPKGPK